MPVPTSKKTYTIESEVEKTVQHEGNRYGISLDGQWYNGFGPVPCAEGDTVCIAFEKVAKGDQTYRNVRECTVLEAAKPAASGAAPAISEAATARNECINRSVALKAAVEFALGFGKSEDGAQANIKFVLSVARRFEQFLNCDDREDVLG